MTSETQIAISVHSSQLVTQGQQISLADAALSACGLVRPGCEGAVVRSFSDGESENEARAQMQQVILQQGVEKRFELDFGLARGVGQDVPERETETQFLNRAILMLKTADVTDIIKALDRVEKTNRQAAVKDEAFAAQRRAARAKVARDECIELDEDAELGTWHKGSPEEFAEEYQAWWAKLEGDGDFAAYAGAGYSQGNAHYTQVEDTVSGLAWTAVQQALEYFQANISVAGADAWGVAMPVIKSLFAADAVAIKTELAKWSPAQVVSAYKKLSIKKHPDKEGGSPEAFRELTSHAQVLMEACGYRPGTKRGGKSKQVASTGRCVATKPAICAELPQILKPAMGFFGLSEEDFVGHCVDIKKLRLKLGALKEQKEKEIQQERGQDKLSAWLRDAQLDEKTAECASSKPKGMKQLKSSCASLCREHYTALYMQIQKMS